jgi:hypothetical protein
VTTTYAPTTIEAPAPTQPLVERERSGPLKLSEAMRLATMQQAFGEFQGADGSRCAAASAADVLGVDFCELGHILDGRQPRVHLPCEHAGGRAEADVWNGIVHLNDEHEFSRGKIADWLEANGL